MAIYKRHLPEFIFKYPRTRVIINCTELKVEKPSATLLKKSLGLITKAAIHSNYSLESPLQEHLVSSLTFTLGQYLSVQ